MNLAKFLKGTTTIKELENMPNRYIQTIFKEYFENQKDPKKQEAAAAENIEDQIEEAMS